mmetsp:Transcript_894/g.2364  ORF Transcript_894/g.2364 Transcript_894/m.2364 type:complete len:90 (-) Transcript_894:12-281(-)
MLDSSPHKLTTWEWMSILDSKGWDMKVLPVRKRIDAGAPYFRGAELKWWVKARDTSIKPEYLFLLWKATQAGSELEIPHFAPAKTYIVW